MRRTHFSALPALLLALIAGLYHAAGQGAVATGPAPAVAAQYETRSIQLAHRPQARTQRWYLLRSERRIETWAEDAKDAGERQLWQRDTAGEIRHARLFPADRRVVDYQPGDLRALGRYPDWQRLGELIDAGLLDRLKDTGPVTVLNREARRYQGQIDGVDLEIWWLLRERLPALLRRGTGDREIALHLLALHPLADTPWPPADSDGFVHLDYTDLGDMEADPFVQRLHANEGHAKHGH